MEDFKVSGKPVEGGETIGVRKVECRRVKRLVLHAQESFKNVKGSAMDSDERVYCRAVDRQDGPTEMSREIARAPSMMKVGYNRCLLLVGG